MPDDATPWDLSLRQSVSALSAAAEEFRYFAQETDHAAWRADMARLNRQRGEALSLHGRLEPHSAAQERIESLTRDMAETARAEYEQAALRFAYATAMALSQVLSGLSPRHAETPADEQTALTPLAVPDLTAVLPNSMHARQLSGCRIDLEYRQRCRWAAQSLDEDASEGVTPDYMSGARVAAMQAAEGLADAAYGFGLCAEAVLLQLLSRKPTDQEEGA